MYAYILSIDLVYDHDEKLSYRRFVICIVHLILMSITNPPPPSSKNLPMNEGWNSLLKPVQPFQAYMLGSYPMDNIISVIIIISCHTIY